MKKEKIQLILKILLSFVPGFFIYFSLNFLFFTLDIFFNNNFLKRADNFLSHKTGYYFIIVISFLITFCFKYKTYKKKLKNIQ
jgi:hypothetical protein